MQLSATQEGVIVLTDTETGEPVAIIRRNGSIQWFTVKEANWSDFEQILNVTAPASSHE